MNRLGFAVAGGAVAFAALVTACFNHGLDEDLDSSSSHVEAVDPLEGAYEKQGGTVVHFLFRRGDEGDDDTFLGEIDIDGEPQRAAGKIEVGRDNLGTMLTLTPEDPNAATSTTTKRRDAGKPADGGADAGPKPADNRPLVQQAFSGTMHFLKIGKNNTILVRADANGKTAQYKKLRTWCVEASDCASSVQRTGLDCEDHLTCTDENACACGK